MISKDYSACFALGTGWGWFRVRVGWGRRFAEGRIQKAWSKWSKPRLTKKQISYVMLKLTKQVSSKHVPVFLLLTHLYGHNPCNCWRKRRKKNLDLELIQEIQLAKLEMMNGTILMMNGTIFFSHNFQKKCSVDHFMFRSSTHQLIISKNDELMSWWTDVQFKKLGTNNNSWSLASKKWHVIHCLNSPAGFLMLYDFLEPSFVLNVCLLKKIHSKILMRIFQNSKCAF